MNPLAVKVLGSFLPALAGKLLDKDKGKDVRKTEIAGAVVSDVLTVIPDALKAPKTSATGAGVGIGLFTIDPALLGFESGSAEAFLLQGLCTLIAAGLVFYRGRKEGS